MSTKKTFRILATLMFVVCIIFSLSSCDALDNILVKKECAHTMEETAAVAATCEQEGNIQYFTCSTCNKVYLDKDGNTETTLDKTVVAKTNHTSGDEWKIDSEATCETAGSKHKECTVCGETTLTVDIPANGHTEVIDPAVEATCTEAGKTEGKHCSVCNEVLVDQVTVEALGHNANGVVEAVAPTCTEAGVVGGTYCTVCNDGKAAAEAVVEALGHNANGVVEAVAPTCTEAGVVGGTYCTVCNDGKAAAEAPVAATGHNADGSVAAKAPTCTEAGVVGGTYCTVCNDGKAAAEAPVAATGHNANGTVAAKAPTCTEAGVVGGTYCTVCNDGKAAAETVIDALGHNYGEWIDEVPAEIEVDGVLGHYTCSVCSKNFDADKNELTSLVIPALPVPEAGSEENPIFVMFDENKSATVTVPANKTYYFAVYNINDTVKVTVNGEEVEVTYGMFRMPSIFSITNDGAEDAEYALALVYSLGSMENPEVLEELDYYCGEISQAAGNYNGYFYTYTANADGTVTFYIFASDELEGYVFDIKVTNMNTYEQLTLLMDGVDNNGLELVVTVSAGDELQISVSAIQDADGNYYPAVDYAWVGNFAYPVGTEGNPIYPEWNWDDAGANADATVTVPAGETIYFGGLTGMILTVNGEIVEMNEEGVFSITNDGDEDATYVIACATPVGEYNNPADLEEGYTSIEIAEGTQGYYFTWTAPANGTFTFEMYSETWFYVINNVTSGVYGDWQWSDSDPVVNPAVITVNAGDVLMIQVNTYDPESSWWAPAGEIEFYASFEYPAGSEENPIWPEFEWNEAQTGATATVTVPAGATYYFTGRIGGMYLSINGGEAVYFEAAGFFAPPPVFTITNDGDEDATYTLEISYPVGSSSNPAELEDGYVSIEIPADTQGYYFTWTAPANGTFTFEMYSENWFYVINNMTSYIYGDSQWSDSDPVVNPFVITVNAGDVLEIIVNTYDPENPWGAPAGEIAFYASFEYPAGSEENPIWPEFEWNEAQTGATATVTVPAGATYYFTGRIGGMYLSINGGEAVYFEAAGFFAPPPVFTITNDGDEDATYTLEITYPAGSRENPADVVIGENTADIAEGSQGYYFTWTAPAFGIFTFEILGDNWTYVINNMTTYAYGDTQWSDSDPVVKVVTLVLNAGDEIQIIVNTYDPANMWSNPAGTVSFNVTYHAHNIIDVEALDATCIADGYTAHKACTGCDYTDGKTVIKATGHTEETLEAVAPGCETTGLTAGVKCSACGEILVAQNVVSATGHSGEQIVTDKVPTCTEPGRQHGVCDACGEAIEDKEIPALGHTEETLEAVAPTCTATGLTAGKKCSVCGVITVNQDVVPMAAHNELGSVAHVDATCTATGVVGGVYCTACDFGKAAAEEVIPMAAHNEDGFVAHVDATCTATGVVGGKYCTACDLGKAAAEEVIPMVAHNEDGVVEAVAPTCTAEGVVGGKYCTACNLGKAEAEAAIEKAPHNELGFVEHVDATCTAEGVVGGKYCTACNLGKAEAEAAIEKAPHNELGNVEHVDATCTAEGVVGGTYCTACNLGKDAAEAAIEKAPHNELGFVEHVDATCTAEGVVGGVYCTACDLGKAAAEAAIEKAAHNELGNVEHVDATCTAEGVVGGKYCTACDLGKAEAEAEIPMADHNTDGVVEAVAPTCTEDGIVGGTYCTACDFGKDAAEAADPATGHTLIDVEALAKTCYAGGYTAHKACTVKGCGYTEGLEYIDAGHELADVDAKAATCYTDGYNAHKACSACPYTEGKVVAPAGHTGNWVDDGNYEYIVCTTCGRKQTREKNLVIGDVAFPGEGAYTRIDFTDALHATNGTNDGGKYLVFDFDVLIDKNAAGGTTEYVFETIIRDKATDATDSGNLCVQVQFTMKNNILSALCANQTGIVGEAVNPIPYNTPMGETYLTFRVVADLDDTPDASGNYESYYYVYAKVAGTDGPMTLVTKCTKTSTYAGTVARSDSYKVILVNSSASKYILDFKNASFIKTNDANYLYSDCAHEINETVTPATCTADGSVVRACTKDGCGYSVTEVLPAIPHTPGAAATCTTAQTCTACQAVIAPALGHAYSNWVTSTDANYEQRVCVACGRMQSREKNEIVAGELSNTSNVTVNYTDTIHNASNEVGGKYNVFEMDFRLDAVTGSTAGHFTIRIAATDGNTVYAFDVQSYSTINKLVKIGYTELKKGKYISGSGATWITIRVVDEIPESLDANGKVMHKITIFVKLRDADGPMDFVKEVTQAESYGALGKSYKVSIEKSANNLAYCIENASFIRTNDDSYLYSACNHVMSDWTIESDAVACTTDGVAKRSCTCVDEDGIKCNYTETEYISAHNFTAEDALAPTCTEAGHTSYLVCADCQAVVGHDVISALGHDISGWFDINDGAQQKKTCQNGCGYYELRNVVANNLITFDDGTLTSDGRVSYSSNSNVTEGATTATSASDYATISIAPAPKRENDTAIRVQAVYSKYKYEYAPAVYVSTTDGSESGNIYTLDFDLYNVTTYNGGRVLFQLSFGGNTGITVFTYRDSIQLTTVTPAGASSSYGNERFGTCETWVGVRVVFTVVAENTATYDFYAKNDDGTYEWIKAGTITNSGIHLDTACNVSFFTYATGVDRDYYIDNISLTRHSSGYEAQ